MAIDPLNPDFAMRLYRGDRDALNELHRCTGGAVLFYLMASGYPESVAAAAIHRALLRVWADPGLLQDCDLPYDLQMALLAEHAATELTPAPCRAPLPPPRTERSPRLCRVAGTRARAGDGGTAPPDSQVPG